MYNMKKLFVTGISGFFGEYIVRHLQKNWQIVVSYHQSPIVYDVEKHHIDLTNNQELLSVLNIIQPDAILHLAANSKANLCEVDTRSYDINVNASLALAQYAKKLQIPFVFSSTDLVFDGQNAPYSETDLPRPIMQYGKQKYTAEQAIIQHYPDALILRLPLIYGLSKSGKGFMNAWKNKFEKGEPIHCFTDEYRTAASGDDIANGIFLLLDKKEKGTFHLGGCERMSRYEFAIGMANYFGFSKELVVPSLQKEGNMPAARPADVSLDSSKAFALGYEPKSLQTYLSLH